MQRVSIVAGDDVTGSVLQDIFGALAKPAILTGFELLANGQSVKINPGAGLMDGGVFVFNDDYNQTRQVSLSASTTAKEFTVLYRYQKSNTLGGSPADVTIEEGLINPDTFTGGLILGWIKHQGGSTFNQADFISGRRAKLEVPLEKSKNDFKTFFAPFSTKWALTSGPQPQMTEGWSNSNRAILTTLTNATSAPLQQVTYRLPISIPAQGLGQLLLEAEVPNTANLTVSFIDTAGSEYTAPNAAWTFIASPMNRKILQIPQNKALSSGQMAFIKLVMNIQPGSFVRFKTLGYSSYTEPF